MTINIEKMQSDMRWEFRRFAVSLVVAAAAIGGAGAAIGSYLTKQQFQSQVQTPAAPTADRSAK